MSRYKQFHIDNLKSSMLVNLPVRLPEVTLNKHGQYWNDIANYMFGLHDVRARRGTFTNPWGASSNPIFVPYELEYNDQPLSVLLDRRSTDLLSLNQPIAIMWSGGIDSTCVLSSFIKNAKDTSQIIVYCNTDSIAENPKFYKNQILDKLECRNTQDLDVTNDFLEDYILIHGDPGDCLFGPSMTMYTHLLADMKHLSPWRDNKDSIVAGIMNQGASEDFANWYTDKISDNIQEVNVEGINTISDWWWWHYFNFKWEFSIMRPLFQARKKDRSTIKPELFQKFVNNTFLNTDYFQNWSYSNLNRLCRDPELHKIDAKKYIFELDHDMEYFSNKKKTASPYIIDVHRPVYMDKDLRRFYSNDPELLEALTELLNQYNG